MNHSLAAALVDRVDFAPGVAFTGCWTWQGKVHHSGYARFGRERRFAHRTSYETFIGPIPAGLDIDHLCRNRACINPMHLEPVTRRTNLVRGMTNISVNARKTMCWRGHDLVGRNLVIKRRKNGRDSRACRKCERIRDKQCYQRSRELN